MPPRPALLSRPRRISLLAYSIVGAAVRHPGSRLLAPLRSPVLTFFGLISYCLYMSHTYVLSVYDQLFGPVLATETTHLVVRFFAVLAATIVLCVISRYALELPAMRLRRLVLRRA
jgi:peptidoglycan/LPS O-acetylase OafA/YrhL